MQRAEARTAGARVPAGHVAALGVGVAFVLPCGAFVDVQLALGAVEAPTTRALPRSHTTTAILTRTLANGYFFGGGKMEQN